MKTEFYAICKCGWSFYIKKDSPILWQALEVNNSELVSNFPNKTDEDLICLLSALHEQHKGKHKATVHQVNHMQVKDMKHKTTSKPPLENI